MGKETGFLEIDRRERDYIAPEERLKNYREFIKLRRKSELTKPGGALHELRHPVLSQRLSGEQHHPGLEPPGL